MIMNGIASPSSSHPLVAVALFLLSSTWFALSILMFAVDYLLGVLKLKAPVLSQEALRAQINKAATATHMQAYVEQRARTADECQHVSFSDAASPRESGPAPSRALSDRTLCAPSSPTRSVSSSTLVSRSSPSRLSPPLPRTTESKKAGVSCSRAESSPASSLSVSPRRPQMPLRLPTSVNMNMFRKSRRPPAADKQRAGSDPGSSTATQKLAEQAQRNTQNPPGESYRTTFVNPFRLKPLRSKTVSVLPTAKEHPEVNSEASIPASPPRRSSSKRLSLPAYLNINLNIQTSILQSPRPRTPREREGVPRTQPYGAPYFAAMPSPVEVKSRRSASCSSSPRKGSLDSGSRNYERLRAEELEEQRMRGTSLVSGFVPPVKQVNALGLSLGSGEEKRSTRHRPTKSDGVVVVR
ncbi:hypothetical protein SCP_0101320 [Sparassis crispa]|uniref:Uncharacterized protein n=1 Tax=Sparassis crispa TaxID=139825 RepID=A0A401G527_9APHY|nr:hypothetical protein SCP_0101320 [Sparassis crispa]GBE77259.1 hypothetical protein SCP_0101320 [Sparassis crispa]